MYESLTRSTERFGGKPRHDPVAFHQGDARSFLSRHLANVSQTRVENGGVVSSLAPRLFSRIADPRTLRLAWDDLARDGGTSPGPDGMRYRDLGDAEVWCLCRALTQAIRKGDYRPAPERIVMVPIGTITMRSGAGR